MRRCDVGEIEFESHTVDGVTYAKGDYITCYYAWFYRVVGFFRNQFDVQVVAEQVYDSNGKKKKAGMVSCHIGFVKKASLAVSETIERLERETRTKIESLRRMQEEMRNL